jgi:thiol-disulfide isomerase/thioredoxin
MHVTPSLKTIGVLMVVLALVGFLTYSYIAPGGMFADLQNDLKAIDPGDESAYTDLDGNHFDLGEFKGKPLVVNAWATWMPFSQSELSLLSNVQEEYAGDLTVLAINRMEDTPVIRAYLALYGLVNMPVRIVRDPTDNFYKAVGGYAMPETVFYRADGTIYMHKRGVLTEDELRTALDGLVSSE